MRLAVDFMDRSDQLMADAGKAALNVLIVEDEMLIAFDLEMQVEDAGHTVVGLAQNLATCKDLVRKCMPDVVLMDLRLKGGESGEDVARWLKDELKIRCIFISGNLDDAMCEKLRAYDPIAFVGKPVLPFRLTEALAKASPRMQIKKLCNSQAPQRISGFGLHFRR